MYIQDRLKRDILIQKVLNSALDKNTTLTLLAIIQCSDQTFWFAKRIKLSALRVRSRLSEDTLRPCIRFLEKQGYINIYRKPGYVPEIFVNTRKIERLLPQIELGENDLYGNDPPLNYGVTCCQKKQRNG